MNVMQKVMPRKKEYSLSLNRFLEIVTTKEQLTYLKLIPHTSSRNYKSIEIPKIINNCYEDIRRRFHIENKTISFKLQTKVGFYIYLDKKGGVAFFLICPSIYKQIFIEKIYQSWEKVEVIEVSDIPRFEKKCSKASMEYVKEDAMSLNTISKKSNEFLRYQLNVLDIMEDESERIGIYYNFQPTNFYSQLGFKTKYCKTMDNIKKGKSVTKTSLNPTYIIGTILRSGFKLGDEMRNLLVEILDGKEGKLKERLQDDDYLIKEMMGVLEKKELSKNTKDKAHSEVLKTQIVIFSEANTKKSEKNNLYAVAQSFHVLDGDNKLRPRTISRKKHIDMDQHNMLKNTSVVNKNNTIYMSVEESSSIVVTPSREIINKYNIPSNNVTEVSIPKSCQNGYIPLGKGIVGRKKVEKEAYLNPDADIDTGLLILGKQGVGKTKFQVRYVKSCADNNDSCVVIDFIGKNDLCNEIEKVVDKEKLVIIDLSNLSSLPAIAYNEITYNLNDSVENKMDIIGIKTQYNVQLINSFNDGNELTSPMRRFFVSASNITYACNQHASFQDTINCLEDYDTRMESIKNIPDDLREYLEDDIKNILKLNAKHTTGTNKGQDTGETAETKIDRILDRVSIMKESMRTKIMFSRKSEDSIDFEKSFNDGKIILIKMKQSLFGSDNTRNFLSLFFTTKVWSACVNRESKIDDYTKLKRVHLVIDEVFQVQKTLEMLKDKLPQVRKFRLKPVFSSHNLSQIEIIKSSIKNAGFSYMLLAGTDKGNFKLLEEELEPFEIEDLLNLKRFYSLNLITANEGRLTPFITRLPPLFKDGNKSIDSSNNNENINDDASKKYYPLINQEIDDEDYEDEEVALDSNI